VEGLARSLEPGTESQAWSPLVAIQPAGSNPPFFCVHPIFGVVFPYYELAYHLGTDQPFYALQPLGIDGEQPPLTRIEDMAAHYIKALRTVQPKVPTFWEVGLLGVGAFEMAQQLVSAGHQVALVAVLDTVAQCLAINLLLGWSQVSFHDSRPLHLAVSPRLFLFIDGFRYTSK
jgi:thioesterase domain-containing protein